MSDALNTAMANFEGHMGSYDDVKENTDLANGERMEALFGGVLRRLGPNNYRAWVGTHWEKDDGCIAALCAASLSERIDEVEMARAMEYANIPMYEGWNVQNLKSGKAYSALLGKYGALTNDPSAVTTWLGADAARLKWFGDRLEFEAKDQAVKDLEACVKYLKSDAGMKAAVRQFGIRVRAEEGDFDQVRHRIVLLNGTLDTRTGEFHEGQFDPADLNTRIIPMRYNPEAKAPKWRSFIETNQPTLGSYLQKLVGYAMTGDSDQKAIFLFWSEQGDTGKSTFVKVVSNVMGSAYAAELAEDAIAFRRNRDGGRDPDRDAIRGKRFVFVNEWDPKKKMDTRFIKQLSGGDGVSTRGNYDKGNKQWRPECLLIISSNHKPDLDSNDNSVWNRLRILTWNKSFPPGHPDRIEGLADQIISEEAEGVFAWMVEGLRRYRKRNDLTSPTLLQVETSKYRDESNVVDRFVRELSTDGLLARKTGEHSQLTQLFEMAKAWGRMNHLEMPASAVEFKKRLLELKFEYKPLPANHPNKTEFGNSRRIRGLGITSEAAIRFKLNKEQGK